MTNISLQYGWVRETLIVYLLFTAWIAALVSLSIAANFIVADVHLVTFQSNECSAC